MDELWRITFSEWLEVADLLFLSLSKIMLHKSPCSQRNAHRLETFIQFPFMSHTFNLEAATILAEVGPHFLSESFIVH